MRAKNWEFHLPGRCCFWDWGVQLRKWVLPCVVVGKIWSCVVLFHLSPCWVCCDLVGDHTVPAAGQEQNMNILQWKHH